MQSRCPSYVGLKGIVIQETQHVFRIVTEEDKVKTIPKAHSIFSLVVGDQLLSIYGNHFLMRSSKRATHKFKHEPKALDKTYKSIVAL